MTTDWIDPSDLSPEEIDVALRLARNEPVELPGDEFPDDLTDALAQLESAVRALGEQS